MNTDSVSICLAVSALVISVTGWIVTHSLGLRSQKHLLINKLRNEARIAITTAIREFHDCCIEMIVTLGATDVDDILESAGDMIARSSRSDSLKKSSIALCTFRWARLLEEYESLFPETAAVRVKLLDKTRVTLDEIRDFANEYEKHHYGTESSTKESCIESLHDLVALTWDLLVHIQNKCIGTITGHTVHARQFKSPVHPRIVTGLSGELEIVSGPSV